MFNFRKFRIVMKKVLFLLFIVFFLFRCNKENHLLNDYPSVNEVQQAEESVLKSSFPGYSFYLPVLFLTQVLPGDWSNTKNCGQACVTMLAGYFNNSAVNSSQITAQNAWLYGYTGDYRYNDANGYYTSATQLQALLSQKHGLSSSILYGSCVDDILSQAYSGKPCIVHVRISGGTLVSSGGVEHWVLVVGFDGYNVIVNDPGSSSGNGRAYSKASFFASWSSAGNKLYMPVSQ